MPVKNSTNKRPFYYAAYLSTLISCIISNTAAIATPSVFPTGVTRYDPTQAYNSYVLFSGADHKTHLIDMNGHEVHRWDYEGFPSGVLDPKVTGGQLGQVFVQLSSISGAETSALPGVPAIFKNKEVGVVDWKGKVLWHWGEQATGGAARQHHDWARLANGNTIILANELRKVDGFKLPKILDDVIYEVSPEGKVLWKWSTTDHLNEFGFSPEELKLIHESSSPDYLHINNLKPVGENHWFKEGDARFNPDNILIDSRNANFIVIIDKKTGHITWRVGPDYPKHEEGPKTNLPASIDQLSGQHDAQIIPEGLPGAGNLLVFDNQGSAGYPAAAITITGGSRVLEIDPVKKQIVWQYTGEDSGTAGWNFYSSFISSARRLPNGNTLIDEGYNGRFFQITPQGKIVWEYVSPYFGESPSSNPAKPTQSNWVYRAQPVSYDWIPAGTPHSEQAVTPPSLQDFHIPETH